MQEIHRARDRSSCRIVSSQSAVSHLLGEKGCGSGTEGNQSEVTSSRHQKGPQHSKDLYSSHCRTCRAWLNGMSWNAATVHQPVPTRSQHLTIGDSPIRDLTKILVVGQSTPVACSRASVTQVIKMMELHHEDRVETLINLIGLSDKPSHPQSKMVTAAGLSPQCIDQGSWSCVPSL